MQNNKNILAFKKFWNTQNSSLHRDGEFIKEKAIEHTDVLNSLVNLSDNIADIGCGFGELLIEYLKNGLNITHAVDFSDSAVNASIEACSGHSISISTTPVDTFIANSDVDCIIACASINQFLNGAQMRELIELFIANSNLKLFVMFDCIDPILLDSLSLWSRYENHGLSKYSSYKKHFLFCLKVISKIFKRIFTFSPFKSEYLGISMGYAYPTSYWHYHLSALHLKYRIVSSKYYEYRYHVIISK